jgi:hypothetical protein
MKTRNEIIVESVNALRACYNYYSDEPLGSDVASALFACLSRTLPREIPTEQWQELADQYEARVLKETTDGEDQTE